MKPRTIGVVLPVLLITLGVTWVAFWSPEASPPPLADDLADTPATDITPAPLTAPALADDHAPRPGAESDSRIYPVAETAGEPTSSAVALTIPDYRRAYTVVSKLEIRVKGRVVDDVGLPVPGARIYVGAGAIANVGEVPDGMTVSPARAHFDDTEVAFTDHAGRFQADVALGLDFESAGLTWLELHAVGAFAASDKVDYDWWDGRDTQEIRLKLPARGGVAGRVIDPWGNAVAGTVVLATPAVGVGVPSPLPDAVGENGAFEIRNLAPGLWNLAVFSEDWTGPEEPLVVEVYADMLSALPEDIVVTPRRRLHLSLTINGRPFHDVDMVAKFVMPDGSVIAHSCRSRDNGGVYLPDPPPQAKRLLLSQPRHQTIEVVLPDMSEPALYELGQYGVIPTR